MSYIKNARRTLGLNQSQLAELLGITQPSISRLEQPTADIDPRTFLAIEALLTRHKTKATR